MLKLKFFLRVSAVDNFDLPLMAFGGKLGRLHDLVATPLLHGPVLGCFCSYSDKFGIFFVVPVFPFLTNDDKYLKLIPKNL
jgi:hypothetical protein